MDDLQMETHLNMDLVRKTKVTFNLPSEDLNNIPKFEISPKIEKLVEMNIAQIELKHKCNNISEGINDKKMIKKIIFERHEIVMEHIYVIKIRNIHGLLKH